MHRLALPHSLVSSFHFFRKASVAGSDRDNFELQCRFSASGSCCHAAPIIISEGFGGFVLIKFSLK